MSPLRHVPRRIQHWVVPYLMIILALTALATSYAALHATDSARDARIAACERSNFSDSVQVGQLQFQNSLQKLFPARQVAPAFGLTIEQYKDLQHKQIEQNNEAIRKLQPVDCEVAG